jgi:8-oxo-dGTP diphosphatase
MEIIHRASIALIEEGKICLMKRVKKGITYFMLPGGKLEKGESPEAAARREALEELSIEVELGELMFIHEDDSMREHCFAANGYKGEIRLGGEEKANMSEENQFIIEWRDIRELPSLNTHHYPKEVFDRLAKIL